MKERLMTVADVAEYLQVHWQSVLNYIKSGELPAVKLGRGYRISKTDLNDFISKRTVRRNIK